MKSIPLQWCFFVVWGNHPTPWGKWGRFIDLNQDIGPPQNDVYSIKTDSLGRF